MEPKYLAFRRWLYTPIIIWRSVIGSVGFNMICRWRYYPSQMLSSCIMTSTVIGEWRFFDEETIDDAFTDHCKHSLYRVCIDVYCRARATACACPYKLTLYWPLAYRLRNEAIPRPKVDGPDGMSPFFPGWSQFRQLRLRMPYMEHHGTYGTKQWYSCRDSS